MPDTLPRLWTRATLVLVGLVLAVEMTPAVVISPETTPEVVSNGAISGTVFEGTTGEPLPGALVAIQPIAGGKPLVNVITRQVTDERGRFAFTGLGPNTQVTVTATRHGLLPGGYGRNRAPSEPLRPVILKQDEWISGLRITLWKPSAISGVVRDETGEPVVGVYVRVLQRIRIQGREDLAAGAMVTTDDRGAYRLTGLAPARYYIQVPSVQASIPAATKMPANTSSPADVLDADDTYRLTASKYPLPPPPIGGRQMAYPLSFYPATSVLAQATAIDLQYGDDRTSVDLTLTPMPSVRVSGLIEGPPEALQALTLRLLPTGLENLGLGSEAATTLVETDGRFTFLNVPAGTYTLDAPVSVTELSSQGAMYNFRRAFPGPPASQGRNMNGDSIDVLPGMSIWTTGWRGSPGLYSGRMPLVVGGSNVEGVILRLRPQARMSGRVVVEADPAQPDMRPPTRFPIYLDAAGGETYLGRPSSAFEVPPPDFAVAGIIPGQYWLRVLGYPGWLVKSVAWRERDQTFTPFDTTQADDVSGVVVTVTNMVPQLSGTVRPTETLKPESTIVVAFPPDPAQWRRVGLYPTRIKVAAVAMTGAFTITTLPAGEYLVAAIDREHWSEWRDPAFLERLARSATRVTLTWGGKVIQDLQPTPVR